MAEIKHYIFVGKLVAVLVHRETKKNKTKITKNRVLFLKKKFFRLWDF